MADRIIAIEFTELGKKIQVRLDSSLSPNTVREFVSRLPIRTLVNRWGDELYTEETLVVAEQENPRSVVNLYDFAYWPDGKALCLFYGKTPVSKDDKILPYSPVNVVGRIISKENNVQEFLSAVEKLHTRRKIPISFKLK